MSDEISVVVDESDNLLYYKPRHELTINERWRTAGVFLFNNKGDILLAQRALGLKIDPGKWGPSAAGTVEKGEDYQTTALREMAEEIGVKDIELKPLQKLSYETSSGNKRVSQYFSVQIDKPIQDFKLQASEVAAVKWFALADILDQLVRNPDSFAGNSIIWPQLFV